MASVRNFGGVVETKNDAKDQKDESGRIVAAARSGYSCSVTLTSTARAVVRSITSALNFHSCVGRHT